MKFELKKYHRNTPSEEFIDDVRRVAKLNKKNSVSVSEYKQNGKFHSTTLIKRFGSWNKVIEAADLQKVMIFNTTKEDLFKNLEKVWISLGRQPGAKEIRQPVSMYSITPYLSTFGTWQNALEEFVDYIKQDQNDSIGELDEIIEEKVEGFTHKTKREISDRMRFRILMRDGFTCKKCGRSPLKSKDVELHVDHIIPWSKGGETIPDNLETKCKKCNLGKGNAFDV